MRQKILFIVNVDWFFVSHRLPIALKAQDEGYEVHISCAFTDKKDYLQGLGFKLHELPFSRSGKCFISEITTLFAMSKLLKLVKPDLVHAITIKPVLYTGLVLKFVKVPAFVAAISGLGLVFVTKTFKGKVLRWFVKTLYKISFSHKNMNVIFQNPVDKKTLIDSNIVFEEQCRFIKGSGADLNEYVHVPEPEVPIKVIMACRLLREKGVGEFIEMSRRVNALNKGVEFLLVGEPDYGNPNSFTETDIQKWKNEGIVQLLGHSDDVAKLFSQSHIVTLPSYYGEGLPKVLIEAAACGRPIVTTNNPGCIEAVIENETGLIVPVKDIDSLTKAIVKLIDSKELRENMGQRARQFAEEEFDVKSVVAKHLDTYEKLLN